MMQPFTFEEFQEHAKTSERIAVFETFPADTLTPAIIYTQLNELYGSHGVILEDLQQREGARYSFIGFDPMTSLTMHLDDKEDPLTVLRNLQLKYAYTTRAEAAPLITSAMGFMTYDTVRYFEDIPDRHAPDPSLATLLFHFYALSISFDHTQQTILISIIVNIGLNLKETYEQARQKINTILLQLNASPTPPTSRGLSTGSRGLGNAVVVEPSDAEFMCMVEKAKDYIVQGDAFQIVLSRCFTRPYAVSPFDIYQTLRTISPSPFMFYFPTESHIIIGASPERLVRVHNQEMTVNPIAGTRQCAPDISAEKIQADLLSDPKELAEHRMLVDLARNDVGMVSQPGSVKVREFLQVKHYSHISHITSTVTGQLQNQYDALDALAAGFPAGTLSGAPKIRAMQIIDELEHSRRGMYGGAICRLDSLGNLESCIAIRMAVLKDGIATIRTGAGIVYDSDSTAEARETCQKASSMLDAIAQAHGE